MTFNVILFGLGKIGYSYDADSSNNNVVLTHFKAINKSPSFRLLAIVEADAKKYQKIDKKFEPLIFADVNQIQSNKEIDLVVIATPTETHLKVVREALKLRPKAILLEKPVSNSLVDAIKILELSL